MLGIAEYFYRLLPGNPIFLRVIESGGRKYRDLAIRWIYLGLLVVLVLWTLLGEFVNFNAGDIAGLTRASAGLFRQLSYLQLALVALLSPIFTAGAITQERDSQTYDILLATPLTNGQIVLGSLLSRVFFVVALLISGVPIFAVTQIFGGVSLNSIVMSFLVSAATALITGSVAMAMATLKSSSRRSSFTFYLVIVLYLVVLWLLDLSPFFHFTSVDAAGDTFQSQTSWLTPFHPFLALRVILNDSAYQAPSYTDLPDSLRVWPLDWMWTNPAGFYITFMLIVSLVMVLPSIVLLRRLAQATLTPKAWIASKFRLKSADRTRTPRTVWYNPIAWREARTRGSVVRGGVVRYGLIIAGLLAALTVLVLNGRELTPDNFIGPGGYDAVRHTLFIDGAHHQDYLLNPDVEIKIDDTPGSTDDLFRRYAVKEISLDAQHAIASITLTEVPHILSNTQTHTLVLGLILAEIAGILLIVTNAAASTITREKEDGTLDLLLTTPITSRYYLWGKLRGLVLFVLPLIAVPVLSCALFVSVDLFHAMVSPDPYYQAIVFPETLVLLPIILIVISALAAIVGMSMSLQCRTTVRAVMGAIAIVGAIFGFAAVIGNAVVQSHSGGQFAVVVASLSPMNVIAMLIDPGNFGGAMFGPPASNVYDPTIARQTIFVACLVSMLVLSLVVWRLYRGMVKNFDMTIRRQSS